MALFFIFIGLALALFALALALLLGLIRAGQFDDLDSPPWRMLADDPAAADQSDRSLP
jgi:cbb3-type cytochrome oxidase maturation protein